MCRFNWPWLPPMCRVRGCREERRVHSQTHRCKKCTKEGAKVDLAILPFETNGRSKVTNKHRFGRNNEWVDARARESPRRSNPSTAACNWLEQVLNAWNTNQSCTIDAGRVINCAAL